MGFGRTGPGAYYGAQMMSPVQKRRPIRVPPTFNLMVVGGKGTGKTSFLKLLLDTCDIPPSCSPEQLEALEKFKSDTGLWIQYIQVAKKEGARSLVGRITAR